MNKSLPLAANAAILFFGSPGCSGDHSAVRTAVLPSLLTTNGMLVGISSAFRRAGLMFAKHQDYFGVDAADTLVVKGSTQVFNQSVDDAHLAAMRAALTASCSLVPHAAARPKTIVRPVCRAP